MEPTEQKTKEQSGNNEQFDQEKAGRSRKKGFILLIVAILVTGTSYASYTYFFGSNFVSTNNAYCAAEIAAVTPAVGGIVTKVNVVDTQYVKKGDILITLDDADARLAMQQANANYDLAMRRVRSYHANDQALDALVKAREADEKRTGAQLVAAKADFERAQVDFERRKKLVGSGSVSGEELSNAKMALAQAKARLHVAEAAENQTAANRLSTISNRKANNVLIENSTVETNPEVLLAKARYEQTKINLERTIIRAPISGIVANRQIQVGRLVPPGTPLLTVVPIDAIHVDANFKEGKLRKIQIGQQVEIKSDLYGVDVIYRGVVTGLSGGTGSAFSLIPAQNATGNWIKVVQRLPVRIEINREDLQSHPLQVGLSMDVTIDTESMVDEKTLKKYQSAALYAEQDSAGQALTLRLQGEKAEDSNGQDS